MRHRASRSRLASLRTTDSTQRGLGGAAALAVVAGLTSVVFALETDDAGPTVGRLAALGDLGTPAPPRQGTQPPRSDTPPAAASRSGDRSPSSAPANKAATTAAVPTEGSSAVSVPTPPRTAPTPPRAPSTDTPAPRQPAPSPSSSAPRRDEVAPETTASTTNVDEDSWTVRVSANEPASYECSLDSGAYQACGSTTTFRNLGYGRHTLSVRATDRAGNTDPSPEELDTLVTPVTIDQEPLPTE